MAGRISFLQQNIKTYNLLRNKLVSKFDGIWSPTIKSPYHGKFASEIVIFKPSEVLSKPENLPNKERSIVLNKKRIQEGQEQYVRNVRRWKNNPALSGPGTRLYATRVNSPGTVRAKKIQRYLSPVALQGPGKRFFNNKNTSIVNSSALKRLFRN